MKHYCWMSCLIDCCCCCCCYKINDFFRILWAW